MRAPHRGQFKRIIGVIVSDTSTSAHTLEPYSGSEDYNPGWSPNGKADRAVHLPLPRRALKLPWQANRVPPSQGLLKAPRSLGASGVLDTLALVCSDQQR